MKGSGRGGSGSARGGGSRDAAALGSAEERLFTSNFTGAILLGVVSQKWGFGVMWSISATCTLLSLGGFMLDRRHRGSPAK